MAPLIRGSEQGYTASGTAVTINTPAGAASGDILVAFIWCDVSSNTISAGVGGWTNPGGTVTDGTPQMTAAAFHRTLSASPDASYSFSNPDSVGNIMGVLYAVNPNGDTFDTITVTSNGQTAASSAVTTAVTGVADPSVWLCGFGTDDTATVSTAPAGHTVEEALIDGSSMDACAYSYINPGTGSLTATNVWSVGGEKVSFAALLDFTAAGGGGAFLRTYFHG